MADTFTDTQIGALKELQKRRNTLSPEQLSALDELSARAGVGKAARQRKADDVPPEPSMMDKITSVAEKLNKIPQDLAIGAGKGVIDTAYNIAKPGLNVAQGRPAETPISQDFEGALKPENAAQTVGKFAERAGEFAAGDAAVRAGMEAIPLVARGTGLVARLTKGAAAGATSGAGVTAIEGGDTKEVATNAAVGGILTPALEGSGMVLRKLANKMELSHIRPTKTDYEAGFKDDTLEKYNLQGMSLGGTLEKVHQKITDLATKLRDITKNAPGQVDLGNVLADTENELLSRGGRLKNAGDIDKIKQAIDQFTTEAADLGGKATIDEAQTLKRAVGLKGAWSYGKSDADSAMETVANVYQKYLKQAIEQNTPSGAVSAINKQLGELMPVEQALAKRIPVAARQNALSLTDLMLMATGHPVGAAVHVGSKTMGGSTLAAGAGKLVQKGAQALTAGAQAGVTDANE